MDYFFFEKRLEFSRMNIMEMAVFKWHAYILITENSEYDCSINWEFLEEFEPFADVE